jgi:pimeloyl-ACP methyl ester carboxylesterase
MSYAPKLNIKAGQDSLLFLSTQPSNHAVVFIHGFGGSASGTWMGFEGLVAEAKGWDLFFYGYPSWAGQANSHAEGFRLFLAGLFSNPKDIYVELEGRSYQHVVIVAHSLGAIVTRRALLNAAIKGDEFIDKVSMVLFAPAHLGATEITDSYGKALEAIPAFVPEDMLPERIGNALASVAKVTVAKSLRDMLAGSVTLRQLETETLDRLKAEAGKKPGYLVAKSVIYGNGEDIVDANRFCEDPVPKFFDISSVSGTATSRWVPGTDHLQICKPLNGFILPIEEVKEVLKSIYQDNSPPAVGTPSQELENQLVPDSQNRIVPARNWLSQHQADLELVESFLRDHRPKGNEINTDQEIIVRDGMDLWLDRIGILELACLSGYQNQATPPEQIELVALPQVRPYFETYYPAPLVSQFLKRLNGDYTLTDSAQAQFAVQAFLRFFAIQAGFIDKNVFKFRRMLEDYSLADKTFPSGKFFWPDLLDLISSPTEFQKALVSSEDRDLILAAKGYRAFIQFLINLDDFCQHYSDCKYFVKGVRQFYSYWLVLFKRKFQPSLKASLLQVSTEQYQSNTAVCWANLNRILNELPMPEIEQLIAIRETLAATHTRTP